MKTYHPSTPSRRNTVTIEYRKVLTGDKPEKSLTHGFKRSMGRNNQGRITVQHKGGGNKRLYRDIDFKMNKMDIPGKITTIEYDPNRSAFIGVVIYADGEKRYIVLPKTAKAGDSFLVSKTAPIVPGNRTLLSRIPVGTYVHNVEVKAGAGAKLVRSAGAYAQIVANDAGYTSVKMPSSEIRKIDENSFATIGEVSNSDHHLVKYGKAGKSRWRGIRPTVRGSVMNPVDHPYGGGEGKQGRGTRRPKTRHGKVTGGRKTRTPKKYSNHLVTTRRKVGKKR
ncbi:50S ribosomal protein L2 [Candidatus Nomurabacteria bacterium RIFCSPHIGHO2_02_FULL_33_12]|nr:MAG: 50S ribosomal protein L2 [Candidatus Nomurabacteria bacterium RIFCSPHIGHO2_02_FULL_33_12]